MSEPVLVMRVELTDFTRIEARMFAYLEPGAVAHAIAFYDQSRANGATETCARVRAEIDLRIRVPELDSIGAAIVLADALACRATARIGGV